ncbi:hypothetical protein QHH11_09935 [Aphanizomenon sp. PH219]|nr:hypothetical protein [Aphanizomenon sp. 202]MDK2459451.1 hypothetical protein [Aphanizomenon sp. PH219]
MNHQGNWKRKLEEASTQIKTGYAQIGRKTGAAHLAIIYPPEVETAVFKEWQSITAGLGTEFEIKIIDILAVTMGLIDEIGCQEIIDTITRPMPGSDPKSELGQMWLQAILDQVQTVTSQTCNSRQVIVLQYLAALYPATTPRALMQKMWENERFSVDCPIIFFIPGTLTQKRVYSFVNTSEELMYRGDIL